MIKGTRVSTIASGLALAALVGMADIAFGEMLYQETFPADGKSEQTLNDIGWDDSSANNAAWATLAPSKKDIANDADGDIAGGDGTFKQWHGDGSQTDPSLVVTTELDITPANHETLKIQWDQRALFSGGDLDVRLAIKVREDWYVSQQRFATSKDWESWQQQALIYDPAQDNWFRLSRGSKGQRTRLGDHPAEDLNKPITGIGFFTIEQEAGDKKGAIKFDQIQVIEASNTSLTLLQQIDQLEALRQRAKKADLPTAYADVALRTVRVFQKFIRHDAAHPEKVAKTIANTPTVSEKEAKTLAKRLPAKERRDCQVVLDRAIANLRHALDGKSVRRAPPKRSAWPVVIEDGRFVIDQQPVFPGGITWMPNNPANVRAFGAKASVPTGIARVQPDGGLPAGHLRQLASQAEKHGRMGLWYGLWFGGYRAAEWMKDKYPAVEKGGRHFTAVDIDNPRVRQWVDEMLGDAIPVMLKRDDFSHLYMSANEPHFATAEGGWAVSPMSRYTHNKFRDWLKSRHGDIRKLNNLWGSSFSDFESIQFEVPVPTNLIGTPQWYDWCRFNMDRVNDWFTYIHDRMKSYDPEGLQTIKYVSGVFAGRRSHGLDFETLCRLQEVMGCDFHTTPKGARHTWWSSTRDIPKEGPRQAWEDRYALQWRNQTGSLDFMSSVQPDKPIYDSEWHSLSTGKWRDPNLSHEYVRASLWLAYLHGTQATQVWYWGRRADGTPRGGDGFWASLMTQPIALNAFGQTMKELNASAQAISALANAPKQVYIFYSEESAIQDPDYASSLRTIHEALSLLGLRVGFVTRTMLAEADDVQGRYPAIVLPPAEHLADRSLRELGQYAQRDGSLIAVGRPHYTMDEYGRARPDGERAFLSEAAHLPLEGVDQLCLSLGAQLSKRSIKADVKLMHAGQAKRQKLGPTLVYRSCKVDDGYLLSGVNVADERQAVSIALAGVADNDIEIDDLIDGNAVDAEKLSLDPLEVFCFKLQVK
jgi:hypothetical protein